MSDEKKLYSVEAERLHRCESEEYGYVVFASSSEEALQMCKDFLGVTQNNYEWTVEEIVHNPEQVHYDYWER